MKTARTVWRDRRRQVVSKKGQEETGKCQRAVEDVVLGGSEVDMEDDEEVFKVPHLKRKNRRKFTGKEKRQ